MKIVNKLQYNLLKLKKKCSVQSTETVEISDEEYAKYYEVESNHDYSQDYLTFEAIEDGTFSFTINGLYYSINNGASWKSLAAGTETELITKGTKVLWKKDSSMINNTNNYYNDSRKGIGSFSSTGKFNISGNILSLAIDNFNVKNVNPTFWWACAFKSLFMNCINLINAKNLVLPINNFDGFDSAYNGGYYFTSIYSNMFEGCSNLIYGPKILPAIILAPNCYANMFSGCINLLESPILPALNLLQTNHQENWYCYKNMFNGCSSLKKITMLAKNIEAQLPLDNWVKGVLPGGLFIKNSKSTFDNIGDSGIPAGWEIINKEVPEE